MIGSDQGKFGISKMIDLCFLFKLKHPLKSGVRFLTYSKTWIGKKESETKMNNHILETGVLKGRSLKLTSQKTAEPFS